MQGKGTRPQKEEKSRNGLMSGKAKKIEKVAKEG